MKIGLTYDLRLDHLAMGATPEEAAEFDSESTIDALSSGLTELGFTVERIGHVKALVSRLAAGETFDLVFNIAEGVAGFGREAQVPALLEAYGIPYVFSDPLVMSLTLHKGVTKRGVRDLGLPTPDFAVVERVEDIAGIDLPYPLFAKPVAEGTGKGVWPKAKAENPEQLEEVVKELLATYKQPVLVETYLPGREFTVGIVGNGQDAQVLGVMEVLLNKSAEPEGYTFANKQNYEWVVSYRLVDDEEAQEAARVALGAYRGLGIRDLGRLDLRSDANGQPNFMEINPLPGMNPEHSDMPILCRLGGISYADLLEKIMEAALVRLRPTLGLSQESLPARLQAVGLPLAL